jgi:xanthine dehydrogenase accessory factor
MWTNGGDGVHSIDIEVLEAAMRWLDEGHRALLVTVVKTWGSSPRPEGAMLVVRGDGHVMGSVSGGCIEDDLIDRVRRNGIMQRAPEVVKYGIGAEEARHFGLPCGGTIQLVLEPITQQSGIRALYEAIDRRELVARTLDMATGAVTLGPASTTDGVYFDETHLTTIHISRSCLHCRTPSQTALCRRATFCHLNGSWPIFSGFTSTP